MQASVFFRYIVDLAEIRKFLDSPLKNYSSGMRARLGFSIAAMVKPDILIVDEFPAAGDYIFHQKFEAQMKDLLAWEDNPVVCVSFHR